jgi:mono/diheme cytochrome c family protein
MAFRIFFAIASFAILALCVLNYAIELRPDWKHYQRDYYALLADKIKDKGKAAETAGTPVKFSQIYNPELEVVDRCTICHLGMDNPQMDGAKNPYKVHPGNLLVSHPYQKLGCTICHEGQGLATTTGDAHGNVPHWDRPLLAGEFTQATCTKCHHEDEIPQAPELTRGKHLLHDLGCIGCHRAGQLSEEDKPGPRLSVEGSKVSRKWLVKWLMNPRNYLPKAKMPNFHLHPQESDALAAYLMTFKDKAIDSLPESKGDHDAGANVLRESQCVACHVTREDSQGNGVGGIIGPDLRKVGNKANVRWLTSYFLNPHAFYPHTKMPRFHFSEQAARDLAQYAVEEWTDVELEEAEKKEPAAPPDTPELIGRGKELYAELNCTGCHELAGESAKSTAPDLTFIGSKPAHSLDFGDAKVRHTLPDYLFTKVKTPRSLASDFRVPPGEDPSVALWKNLQPAALFSKAASLPPPEKTDRLAWILGKVQERGIVAANLKLPGGTTEEQADWLTKTLNQAGALNPLKMPDFLVSDTDAKALTIALLSQSAEGISSKIYEVPRPRKVAFDPKDDFGALEQRYRCLSCHSIRGSGDPQACDITYEGSKVNRQWLSHFLKHPYSMRRTITIAMPLFNFPEDDAQFMADYMSQVFVDRDIGATWRSSQKSADDKRGKTLFDAKGCIACHQLHDQGGDVGPSFTTQVPDFGQGTWVGDKLRGEWIFQWLKNPQALVPNTLEPNLGLTDQETLDLTAYLLSIKNPEFQKK